MVYRSIQSQLIGVLLSSYLLMENPDGHSTPPAESHAPLAPSSPTKESRSTLISKNVTIDGHRTSVRLEPTMWSSLKETCRRERVTMHVICSAIAQHKPENTSLTAAIRVFIVSYFRTAATEEGHAKSGHGQGPAANAVIVLVKSVMDPGSVPYPLPSPHIIGKAYTPPTNVTPITNSDRRWPPR